MFSNMQSNLLEYVDFILCYLILPILLFFFKKKEQTKKQQQQLLKNILRAIYTWTCEHLLAECSLLHWPFAIQDGCELHSASE